MRAFFRPGEAAFAQAGEFDWMRALSNCYQPQSFRQLAYGTAGGATFRISSGTSGARPALRQSQPKFNDPYSFADLATHFSRKFEPVSGRARHPRPSLPGRTSGASLHTSARAKPDLIWKGTGRQKRSELAKCQIRQSGQSGDWPMSAFQANSCIGDAALRDMPFNNRSG